MFNNKLKTSGLLVATILIYLVVCHDFARCQDTPNREIGVNFIKALHVGDYHEATILLSPEVISKNSINLNAWENLVKVSGPMDYIRYGVANPYNPNHVQLLCVFGKSKFNPNLKLIDITFSKEYVGKITNVQITERK